MEIFPCRVCGLDQGSDQWNPAPTYDFCDCCSTEFGVHDITLGQVQSVRMHWLTTGAKWANKKTKPDNWHTIEDLTKQLKNVPYEWW